MKGNFCVLQKYNSIKDLLKSLGVSNQAIKRSTLKKNYLDKSLIEKDEVYLPPYLLNRGMINPVYSGPLLEIINREGDIMALSKPSRIHCHPLHYEESDNALSFLRERGEFSYLNVNRENMDRGLLFRLDFETSGLLLLTNNPVTYQMARETEFFKRKTYLALVQGEYKGPSVLNHNLSTSGKVVREDKNGKSAQLEISNRIYFKDKGYSCLWVVLKEGLRHQIRIQLALTGFPLVGDTLYGGKEEKVFGLHCYHYESVHNEYYCECPAFSKGLIDLSV